MKRIVGIGILVVLLLSSLTLSACERRIVRRSGMFSPRQLPPDIPDVSHTGNQDGAYSSQSRTIGKPSTATPPPVPADPPPRTP
ncbi:MAG: hypothetical protein WD042_00195 [Phycisphaeraceae bacterium]